MNKLLDLRFVIGAFFLIVGLLLLVYSFVSEGTGTDVNRWCGLLFLVFAVVMIVVSLRKEAHDELLEESGS